MPLSDIEINTLGVIYDALLAVDDARTDDTNSKSMRAELGKLYRHLDAARSLIIDKHVETYLSKLEERSADLGNIVAGIKKDIDKIKKLAVVINKAADAIKFIVNTAKGAMAAGLL